VLLLLLLLDLTSHVLSCAGSCWRGIGLYVCFAQS
jgi:hypothetical protein